MENKSPLIIGLLAGFVLGFVGSYLIGRDAPGHMMSDGSLRSRDIDQHFIAEMIPHHEGAIDMAKVALERSKRPEILSLAEGIIEAQEAENKNMRAWYEEWFGSAPPAGGMGMHMDGMAGDLEALRSASNFDREFIEQMIPHHEMAITMARMLQASTERTEMQELADQIITSQTREIEMMRSWLSSWY